MLKHVLLLALSASLSSAGQANASERYQNRPPVMVSPDLSAPWVMQLGGVPDRPRIHAAPAESKPLFQRQTAPQRSEPRPLQQAAMHPVRPGKIQPTRNQLDPIYLPQMVDYATEHRPGTVVIDTNNRFLYLVMADGKARRYGVGVGKPGFEWAGTHKVTQKREWPDWRPPAEMRKREAAKGHHLPVHMAGGPENPLGARALYLGSTMYRIHGTNAPWSIGSAVSSGCIRMRNEDVVDLYERVAVGTKVIVM